MDNYKNLGYEMLIDVEYGQGTVMVEGELQNRNLLLDVYLPSLKNVDYTRNELGYQPYPAVILVHGGGFQRGGRRQHPYKEDGALHSRMEDYAQILTPLGFVCFVVEYRLAGELPEPEMSLEAPWLTTMDEGISDAGLARANKAREAADLEPLEGEEGKTILWKTVLSAAEDIRKAVDFVRSTAPNYNVDPDKIALGGHSAGATTIINAVYGLDASVKATFPLSPVLAGIDVDKAITSPHVPPMLHCISQFDEPAALEKAGVIAKRMHEVEANYELVWIPGFPHFYPRNAVSLSDNATRTSLQERLIEFLNNHLK